MRKFPNYKYIKNSEMNKNRIFNLYFICKTFCSYLMIIEEPIIFCFQNSFFILKRNRALKTLWQNTVMRSNKL